MEDTSWRIEVSAGNTVTLPDVVAGEGALVKAGDGLPVAVGDNLYTGTTWVGWCPSRRPSSLGHLSVILHSDGSPNRTRFP